MALPVKQVDRLRKTQRAMERTMLHISLRDRIRNEEVRRRTKVEDVVDRLTRAKWRWAGHVAREDDSRWTTRVMKWRPRASKRSVGRPQKRWADDIKKTAGPLWYREAQDRERWKVLGETYVQEWATG